MSRADVLVDADWAEAHLDDPKVVFVEVDEDVSAYDGGHIKGAVRLDWTTELQQPEARDLIDRDDFSKLADAAKGISNDDTVVLYGGNNNWFAAYAYWQFKLYGHARRQAARRRPQEVGARRPRARQGRPRAARDVVRRRRTPTCRSARSATRSSPRSAQKNLVDVRSPDEFSGKIKAPAHLPQEQCAARRPHPDRDQHPVEQGRRRRRHVPLRRRARRSSTASEGFDDGKLDHRLLPHRRALLAHLVRAARAARQDRRQELRRLLGRVRLPRRRARSRRTSDVRRA